MASAMENSAMAEASHRHHSIGKRERVGVLALFDGIVRLLARSRYPDPYDGLITVEPRIIEALQDATHKLLGIMRQSRKDVLHSRIRLHSTAPTLSVKHTRAR